MDFKSIARDDIDKVFFDNHEFADMYEWDGREIQAIEDTDEIKFRYSADFQAFPAATTFIFAPVSCFEIQPQIGSAHSFNHNIYTIEDIKEEDGVYAILLFYGGR